MKDQWSPVHDPVRPSSSTLQSPVHLDSQEDSPLIHMENTGRGCGNSNIIESW